MAPLTQPLRNEHKDILPHIEKLRAVADSVGDVPIEVLRRGVDEAYAFLTHHLIPHAESEEHALYPVVAELLGSPEATATMSRDHVEVGLLTLELASLRSRLAGGAFDVGDIRALRRLLYGLYTLVKVHFAKEEEIYLTLLDVRLTPVRARQLVQAMERAAVLAKAHAS